MKLKSFLLLLLCVSTAEARENNVADHGFFPGKDVTYEVNRLIELVRGESGVTLVFPKGQYDFHPENAVETYRAVVNHDNGLQRMAFPLFDCEDITIDGGGSLFMFHGRMIPFTLERVPGATLKHLSIDWIRSFHAELTVVESDEANKSFVVNTDSRLYPYSISDGQILFERYGQHDPIGANIVFDPETRAPIFKTKDYSVNSKRAKVTAKGAGRFQIERGVKRPPPVGTILVVYGVHPTSRLCHAIQVTNSRNVRIESVTVHEAGGTALIVERTNNITLDGMVVTSNEERIEQSGDYPTMADFPAINLEYCYGVAFESNVASGFDRMLEIAHSEDATHLVVVDNLGFSTK